MQRAQVKKKYLLVRYWFCRHVGRDRELRTEEPGLALWTQDCGQRIKTRQDRSVNQGQEWGQRTLEEIWSGRLNLQYTKQNCNNIFSLGKDNKCLPWSHAHTRIFCMNSNKITVNNSHQTKPKFLLISHGKHLYILQIISVPTIIKVHVHKVT